MSKFKTHTGTDITKDGKNGWELRNLLGWSY
ncbi:hypothetical protein SK58_01579 [Enterobacter sp. BIDMC93]|nr:hypothetical protein SK58_01579 [Enterobacter sp. BIDMC93]